MTPTKATSEAGRSMTPRALALTSRQELAALALAGGATLRVAAEQSGASARAITGWTRDLPAFRARVDQLRSAMTTQAVARLGAGMAAAASTLTYLAGRGRSEAVRLGAARAVLELGDRLRTSAELEQRIAALETGGQDR